MLNQAAVVEVVLDTQETVLTLLLVLMPLNFRQEYLQALAIQEDTATLQTLEAAEEEAVQVALEEILPDQSVE
jgi:hypothetical protein